MGKIKPEDYTVGKRIGEICKEAGKKRKMIKHKIHI